MKDLRIFILAGSLAFFGLHAGNAPAFASGLSFSPAAQASRAALAGGAPERRSDRHGSGELGRGGNREERREQIMNRIENLPPEQREQALQRLDDMRKKREQIRAELEALPPDERKAKMEDIRRQYEEKRAARQEQFRGEFRRRWNAASSEERNAFCDKAQERCASDRLKACDFIGEVCGESQ